MDKGLSWTEAVIPPVGEDPDFVYFYYGADYVHDRFLALAQSPGLDSGYCAICQSLDGINWTVSNVFDRWSLYTPIKFFYFKGEYCALGRLADHGDPPTANNVLLKMTTDNIWTDTNITGLEGFIHSSYYETPDESTAVGNDYICVLSDSYPMKAYTSPDGINWTQVENEFVGDNVYKCYYLNNKFYLVATFPEWGVGTYEMDESTLIPYFLGYAFLAEYIQPFYNNGVWIYSLYKPWSWETEIYDYRIWKYPVPLELNSWTTESTGIPATMQLRQLLG